MEEYLTFLDKKISKLDDIESEFKIKLDNKYVQNSSELGINIITSTCTCFLNKKVQDLIENINNFKIKKDFQNLGTCVICRFDLMENTDIVGSYGCDHYYHFICIQKWLQNNSNCPLCNNNWKFIQDKEISVCFNDETVMFPNSQTKSDVCKHFNVDENKYSLCKNGIIVDECLDGFHGLCTIDYHTNLHVEITVINSMKFETKKIYANYSTKITELKSQICHLFGILADHTIFIHNGIKLCNELDNYNLFNVGFNNGSIITLEPQSDIKYQISLEDNYFVIYSNSKSGLPLVGSSSWYPSAYVNNITTKDISVLLSSLYILIHTTDKNMELINGVISKFSKYLELYKMNVSSAKSLELLLKSDPLFDNKDRTIIAMSFYELIYKMRTFCNLEIDSILSESNILCDILFSIDANVNYINWTYAKKDVSARKIFTIWSSLALNGLNPPVLTLDINAMVGIYTGKSKDLEAPISLYQPLTSYEFNVDPGLLAKLFNENVVEDNRILTEAIMVCIDTSHSMNGCSDFKEDKEAEKEVHEKHLKEHYKIWDEAKVQKEILEGDKRDLINAIIWFITHPNLSNWKYKVSHTNSNVLKQIVCLENMSSDTSSRITNIISIYRDIFFKLLKNSEVKIDDVIYGNKTSNSENKKLDNDILDDDVPDIYICPINYTVMNDPVILDDGYTYDRSAIENWLSISKKSPMTNVSVEGILIPNRNLKSAISSWIEKCKMAKPKTDQTIQIIRDKGNNLYYNYQNDSNVYDLIYYLYNEHDIKFSTYVLKYSDGYMIRDMTTNLSRFENIMLVKKDTSPIKIKIVDGIIEYYHHNTTTIIVQKNTSLTNLIYSLEFNHDYDMCDIWTGFKRSGDNTYNGTNLSYSSILDRDTTLHIFKELQKKATKSEKYMKRLDVVKKLFDAFVNRSIAYNFPTAIGLMSFNNKSNIVNPISTSYENFRDSIHELTAAGDTALYECINDASYHLIEWKKKDNEKRSNSKLRIICLSDGEDSTNKFDINSNQIFKIKSLLQMNSITLDCILIGNDYDRNLISLSSKTGGYIFNPSDISHAFNIMELETLIVSTNRGKMMFYTPITIIPPMLKPSKLNNLTVHYTKIQQTGKNHILKELVKMMNNPHPDIDIYVSDSDINFWKVVFVGPESSIYCGGCWLAYVQFPLDYPVVPPEIRMVTEIKHCNINSYGRICHSILDRNYVPTLSISTILECIYGLLLNPDVTDPLDTNLAFMYYEGGEYEAIVMEYVKKYASKSRSSWKSELDGVF